MWRMPQRGIAVSRNELAGPARRGEFLNRVSTWRDCYIFPRFFSFVRFMYDERHKTSTTPSPVVSSKEVVLKRDRILESSRSGLSRSQWLSRTVSRTTITSRETIHIRQTQVGYPLFLVSCKISMRVNYGSEEKRFGQNMSHSYCLVRLVLPVLPVANPLAGRYSPMLLSMRGRQGSQSRGAVHQTQ